MKKVIFVFATLDILVRHVVMVSFVDWCLCNYVSVLMSYKASQGEIIIVFF